MPLGILLLCISAGLEVVQSPSPWAVLLMHLAVAGLLFLLFLRASRAGNIIVVAQIAVVFLFSIFCAYVLTIINHVSVEPIFDFSVFSSESVKRVLLLNDFGLGVMLLVYGCHPKMQQPSRLLSSQSWREAGGMTAVPRRLFVVGLYISWGIILWSILLSPNVLRFSYPENNLQPGAPPPTLRSILVLITFALFLIKFVQDKFRTSFMGFLLRMTTYAAIICVGLLGGSRGSSVGLLIGLIALDGSQSRDAFHWKWLFVFLNSLLAIFAVVNWPFMRFWISDIGLLPSFIRSFGNYEFIFVAKSSFSSVYLSDFPMIGQSLFHFLYAIALIDSGNSLHYQTFLNLIPQQLPEFLDGILWTRPINDNWLLADQFHHGGGFYSFANAYWNGGLLALGLFAAVTAWVIARIEIMFKTLPVYYGAAYFMLILLIPVGFYYGIQGLMRGIEFGLIGCVLIRISTKIFAGTGSFHSRGGISRLPLKDRRAH